jgi:hypothetical protein
VNIRGSTGHYPFLDHAMVTAERGAQGVVVASRWPSSTKTQLSADADPCIACNAIVEWA